MDVTEPGGAAHGSGVGPEGTTRVSAPAGATRRGRRLVAWLPDIAIVLLVALALAEVWWAPLHRALDLPSGDPVTAPARIPPPLGLHLPRQPAAGPVTTAHGAGSVDRDAIAAALAPLLADPDLGPSVLVAVAGLDDDGIVYQHGDGAVVPASTMKLLTATAALQALGPMRRFDTVVRGTTRRIVLVGGGDPFLLAEPDDDRYAAHADLDILARDTAAALRAARDADDPAATGPVRVRLAYDDSLFTGPAVNPSWPTTYVPDDVVPPITALWSDQGRDGEHGYVADPARRAARTFRAALRRHGVRVSGVLQHRSATATDPVLAQVSSAPLGEIVERFIAVSDNNATEVVARQVGLAAGTGGSFAGAVTGIRNVLTDLGVDLDGSEFFDGSGLSRHNRLTAAALLDVLRISADPDQPRLRPALTGLPVAGFSGSLQWRFDEAPAHAKGLVRAKTGTLTGVHGLAGVAVDRAGNHVVFMVIADDVPLDRQVNARRTIDEIAAALGSCWCGAVSVSGSTP